MLDSSDLFHIQSDKDFTQKALKTFRFQAVHNWVYKKYLSYLKVNPEKISILDQIPFLPIELFKSHKIITGNQNVEKIFTSSGTTGTQQSQHFVTNLSLYHQGIIQGFHYFYGNFKDYIILPLLPAYAERSGSSLIEMVDFWMNQTGQNSKKYYLYNHQELYEELLRLESESQKIILIGVSFALLDFAEKYQPQLNNTIVIETGGMKGRKKEITRQELHQILKQALGVNPIQSEYGMTELLSQAYAQKDGKFKTPPWMKILLRNTEDPMEIIPIGKTGGINIIDLANQNSCAFIATDDLGKKYADASVEILGRFDYSDIRGCNLLIVS